MCPNYFVTKLNNKILLPRNNCWKLPMLLNCLHLFKLPDNPGQPIPMSGVLNPKKCAIKDLTWFIFQSHFWRKNEVSDDQTQPWHWRHGRTPSRWPPTSKVWIRLNCGSQQHFLAPGWEKTGEDDLSQLGFDLGSLCCSSMRKGKWLSKCAQACIKDIYIYRYILKWYHSTVYHRV